EPAGGILGGELVVGDLMVDLRHCMFLSGEPGRRGRSGELRGGLGPAPPAAGQEGSGQPLMGLGRAGAYVRTFEVERAIRTRPSARGRAEASPSTTGAPEAAATASTGPTS